MAKKFKRKDAGDKIIPMDPLAHQLFCWIYCTTTHFIQRPVDPLETVRAITTARRDSRTKGMSVHNISKLDTHVMRSGDWTMLYGDDPVGEWRPGDILVVFAGDRANERVFVIVRLKPDAK